MFGVRQARRPDLRLLRWRSFSLTARIYQPEDLAALLASVMDNNSGNDRVGLSKFSLDGATLLKPRMNLKTAISISGSQLQFDFDATDLSDGYYTMGLDLDGNGSIDQSLRFYRLRGDLNGDRVVNETDLASIIAVLGQTGEGLPEDLNRDGIVDSRDSRQLTRLYGNELDADLPLDA